MLIAGKYMTNSSLTSFSSKDAHFGNDFRGYSLVNGSCNQFHPLAAEEAARKCRKKPTRDFTSKVGSNSEKSGIYFFSAMAALPAGFPPLIGIIACSYGVPAHII